MEIDIKTKYKPKAGDILSWKDGNESILFVVVENKSIPDKITGIALKDNRQITSVPHIVFFHYDDLAYRLTLELRAEYLDKELANLIDRWNK